MTLLDLSRAEVHHRIEGTGLPLLFLHGAGGNLRRIHVRRPRSAGIRRFALAEWSNRVRRRSRRLLRALRVLEAPEPQLRAAQTAWVRQEPSSFMPGCGARLARGQPSLHWLASAIDSLNHGAGQAVWQRDLDGKFDAQLCPETDPEALMGWRIPTLCIAGEEDVVLPPKALEAVARAIEGAEFVSAPPAGHSVFFERAEEFNGLVHRFLRRHAGSEERTEGSG